MKIFKVLFLLVLVLPLTTARPNEATARVYMTGSVSQFSMDVLPTANFTVDEWFSNPGLWTITIANSADGKTIVRADVEVRITSTIYGNILTGTLRAIGNNGFIQELAPGAPPYTVNNTMINEDSPQMVNVEWSQRFQDEVLRIGYLPEDTYTLSFTLVNGYYQGESQPFDDEVDPIMETMTIRNPSPPELITPQDMTTDAVAIPRFVWQRPRVPEFSLQNRQVRVTYNLKVWRMFTDDGSVLNEEDAINRIPIWTETGLTTEFINFDPNAATEELEAGRAYCWQVQAFDGTGRPISEQNDGKSDVWQFTVQFVPPVINEPVFFFPFNFSWSGAQAGGQRVQYRVRVADNPDFNRAYRREGIVMTRFSYPDNAPALQLGDTYYVELQTTDENNVPIGDPVTLSFTLPVAEVSLNSPEDGAIIPTGNPSFNWTGNASYYVVMLFIDSEDAGELPPELAGWTYMSPAVNDNTWSYDGERLQPGVTYSWNVLPANELGDPIGESSGTRKFSLPSEGQVVLISPDNVTTQSLQPVFTWETYETSAGEQADEYAIAIETMEGTEIYSGTSQGTTFPYPASAPALENATRYMWRVSAYANSIEIGSWSEPATFMTPLSAEQIEAATLEEIGEIMNLVLRNNPEFAGFEDKVLTAISDESGPLTPDRFLELLESYNIISVEVQ